MVTAIKSTDSHSQNPFPAERFVTLRDVPVFVEHETIAKDGRRLRFGRAELEAVCRRCNQRIDQTGDYAAVTLGHTPAPGEQKPEPPVVGFAGPFRLGKVGDKWAILADMHIYREDVERVKKYPRRSPELWLEKTYDRMFMDPIALLGAEAPRLDMGLMMLYQARREGVLVEKYAAVHPSAANVFVPDHEPEDYQKEETMALSQEDIQQLIEALEGLDWVQWAKAQMAAGQPAPEPEPEPEPEPKKEAFQQPSDQIDPEKARQILEDGQVGGKPLTEEQRKMFGAAAAKLKDAKAEHAQAQKYARLEAEVEHLRTQLQEEQAHRLNAERYSRLYELRQQFAFDLDKEVERCQAAKMTPEQFEDHVALIRENYQRLPVGHRLPAGQLPPSGAQSERYQKELAEKAVAICERMAMRGEKPDFQEVLEKLKNGQSIA